MMARYNTLAEQSRAEQSRAEQSRAEQSRAEALSISLGMPSLACYIVREAVARAF